MQLKFITHSQAIFQLLRMIIQINILLQFQTVILKLIQRIPIKETSTRILKSVNLTEEILYICTCQQ